jgi:hypothetical protein
MKWLKLLITVLALALTACDKVVDAPSPEFLDSKLIVRPGVDDLGSVTVREFVSVLSRVKKPDGQAANLLGWSKTDAGYTLRAKVAAEFDLVFQWSKSEKIALLVEADMDGETVPGMQFFMLLAGMPKLPDPNATAKPPVASAEAAATTPTASSSNAKKRIDQATLQGFECGDYCHLKFMDGAGNSQSAICMQVKECQAWMAQPKSFVPMIGKKVSLEIGQQIVPQANAMMDVVTAMTFTEASPAAPPVAAPASSTAASASAAVQPTSPLCVAGEQAVFACSTAKKQIAVCANGGLTNDAVQLAYRIANVGQPVEMTHPANASAAKTAFKFGSEAFMPGQSMSYLTFDKGDIRYVVYSALGKGLDKSGVVVEQGGKRIANLVCTAELIDRLDALDSAGIPTDSRSFALP